MRIKLSNPEFTLTAHDFKETISLLQKEGIYDDEHKKEKAIGARKSNYSSKYSVPSKYADYRKMRNLRAEMKDIAKKVLSNLNFNKNEEMKKLPRHFPDW